MVAMNDNAMRAVTLKQAGFWAVKCSIEADGISFSVSLTHIAYC